MLEPLPAAIEKADDAHEPGTDGVGGRAAAQGAPASRWVGFALGGLGVVLLFVFGWPLARARHLHLDEAHNLFAMQLSGVFGHPEYADPFELYHLLGGYVTRHFATTEQIVSAMRGTFFALFVLLFVGVACVQRAFTSVAGRSMVFLCAVMFAPLWRHGFEIRHDLVLGLGVVGLAWLAERARTRGVDTAALVATGFVVPLMQLDSHKAVLLWLPTLALAAWLDARRSGAGRTGTAARAVARLAAASLSGLAVGAAVLAVGGGLSAYVDRTLHFVRYAAEADAFTSGPMWEYLLVLGGPVSVLALLAVGAFVSDVVRTRGVADADDLVVPVAMLVFCVLAAIPNPTPFPYNMVWIAPGILFAAVGGASRVARGLAASGPRATFLGGALGLVLVIARFATAMAAEPFHRPSLESQLAVVRAAEALTSASDPVLDGAGIVMSRPPPSRDWYIHSLLLGEYMRGERESVAQMITRVAPPVIVCGYSRWSWIRPADHAAVRDAYVMLSPQLAVLGTWRREESARVRIRRAGRYWVADGLDGTPSAGTLRVDGAVATSRRPRQLGVGTHEVTGARGGFAVLWLGPSLDEPPTVRPVPSLFAKARLPGQ